MEICIVWGDGCVSFRSRNNELKVIAENLEILLRPRVIVFIDKIDSYELCECGKKAKKKYIYIYPKTHIQPINKRGKFLKEYTIEKFVIMHQRLSFDEFITVITPGEYLYDYIILTKEVITVAMSGKKEAYFYEEENRLTVYFV